MSAVAIAKATSNVGDAMAAAILRAINLVRSKTRVNEITHAIEAGDIQGAIDAIRWELGAAQLEQVIPQAIRSAYEQAGLEARTALHRDLAATTAASSIRFDLLNPEAVAWIREAAASLIKDFGESSLGAIRALIRQAYTRGDTPGQVATMIRASGIGLDARRMQALDNYRTGLMAAAKTPRQMAQAAVHVYAYGERLLRARARLIARTEIAEAAGEGNRELWRQAKERGLLPDEAVVQWRTTGQENVCPECDELDETTVPVGGTFPPGVPGPPLHPACSCVAILLPFGEP